MYEKMEWVDEHYPQIGSKKIIFSQHKGIINGDVLIDDLFENLNGFSGLRVLFARPWNQHITPPQPANPTARQCIKTGNWDEIIKIVESLGNQYGESNIL